MLILNGIIHTMDGSVIADGYVRTEGSRIADVGHMSQLIGTEGEVCVDARGGHVIPGMIDAHCHVGLYGAGVGAPGDDLNEDSSPCTPHLRAIDGVNPLDDYFREARRAGITCVHTGPGSTNPVAGQSVLMKTTGSVADRMALRAPAAMKFSLGETPKNCHKGSGPVTRMGTAAVIREQLDRGEGVLTAVKEGRIPAHFHAHRADDMVTAVRLSREFGLDCVIVHGTEGYLIADYLAEEGIPVITGPIMTDRSKPELARMIPENTALLARAGVQVAICTDHPETPIGYLPLCAALAARAGMDEEEALAAITINAACILGVDDRLGSLTVGKDADLVVMDGHPFDWRSRVTHVLIDGQQVT